MIPPPFSFQNDVTFHRIQSLFPELPILPEPVRCVLQGEGLQLAVVITALDFPSDQAGLFQHLEMLGNRV
jgi:hypothetical protein